MGKEWQFWCAAGGGSGRNDRREAGSPSGCLSVVYQLFDFHRQVPSDFSSSPASFKQEDKAPTVIKGIEAPRNSLEKDDLLFLEADQYSLSSAMKMEDNLHIPVTMGIQVKTRVDTVRSTISDYSSSPDYLSSPSVKTPTLVARLMGLDLLPDTSSPSPSLSSRSSHSKPTSKSHLKTQDINRKDKVLTGVRSLPETPRVSSDRKSDADRRLSLQSSRDSIDRVGEIEVSGRSRIRIVKREIKEVDEVKERVKEIKEGFSRRFGVEITNRVKNKANENNGIGNRGNENEIVLLKPNKPFFREDLGSSNKYSMKLLEKEKHNQRILKGEIAKNKSFKKNVIKIKQTEPFVKSNVVKNRKRDLINEKKITKKTPLSSEFVKVNGISRSILSVKKEPSFLPTKLPPKQKQTQVSSSLSSKSMMTQLYSSSSHKYKQAPEDKSIVHCTISELFNGCNSITCPSQEFYQYIREILIYKGIYINCPTPITKLSFISLSHDPCIVFNQLELSQSHFGLVSDRKLIFELVHEILGDIFKPFSEFRLCSPEVKDFMICGSELIDKLCKKVDNFPLANCQNLEDIDALIDGDLGKEASRRFEAFHEETEAVLEDIGTELLDRILLEMAMEMLSFDYFFGLKDL